MKRPPPRRRVSWRKTYRIIPTRYPPISLFERVADPEDWDALIEIEEEPEVILKLADSAHKIKEQSAARREFSSPVRSGEGKGS